MAVSDRDDMQPQDARIAALYREGAAEMPPHRLDEIIRKRARGIDDPVERPKQRLWWPSWRLPLAAAAVAVVSASLVTLMREHAGEQVTFAPAPPATRPFESSSGAVEEAPLSERAPEGERAGEAPSRKAQTPSTARPSSGRFAVSEAPSYGQEAKQKPSPSDGPSSDTRVIGRERSEARDAVAAAQSPPVSDAATPRPMPAPPAVASQPQGTASSARLKGESAEVARRVPEAKPAAGAAPAAPAVKPSMDATDSSRLHGRRPDALPPATAAVLISDLAGELPARWIERILALRRDGWRAESDAVLAEFKRRYPDEPLPPSLQRNFD